MTAPLHGEIKMLGTGRGRVGQKSLAEELAGGTRGTVDILTREAWEALS